MERLLIYSSPSQWHEYEVKCKQFCPRFQLGLPITFLIIITVTTLYIYIYIHTHLHTYEDHSINKENFAKGVNNKKQCCTFFKDINCDKSFHPSEHCQHDLLYWLRTWSIFITGDSICFHCLDSLFNSLWISLRQRNA